jgi:hypothetical protein
MSEFLRATAGLPPAEINKEGAQALGKAFWKIAELYRFTREEQALLLGLKADNRQRLNALQSKREIPVDADKFNRVGNLLGIHKCLRIMFPHNRDLVYAWMKTPREVFQNQSALQFIASDPVNSFARLFTVRRILDQIRIGL